MSKTPIKIVRVINSPDRPQVPQDFIDGILHGDADHRRWLQDAADAYNAGQPIPDPR